MRSPHDPSGLRRRRQRLRRHPQHQPGDTRGLRGQRQLAAGDEIELTRFAPDFQHDSANGIAGERVGSGPQRSVDVGCAYRHHEARIETEFDEAAHRQRAGFNFGKILPHPHQRPPRRHPPGKACDKPRRRGTLPACFREHLVHRAEGEAALQRRIGVGMSERHPARQVRIAGRFDTLDPPTQSRKRAGALAHAPLLKVLGRHRLSQVNPRPAHCS
jgi:hypothetical protein